MEDPIKIIHKYKNTNEKIQYHVYIFIGNLVSKNVLKILDKITNMDLYDALINLDQVEYELITRDYGEFWYEKFYISYHVDFIMQNTLNNNSRLKELRNIYGQDWVDKHVEQYKSRFKNIIYNYETMIHNERERRLTRKVSQINVGEEENIDFTTEKRNLVESTGGYEYISRNLYDLGWEFDTDDENYQEFINGDFNGSYNGGYKEEEYEDASENLEEASPNEIDDNDNEDEIDVDDIIVRNQAEEDEILDQEDQDFEDEIENEEDIDKLYDTLDDPDKYLKTTTNLIRKAISENTYDKLNKKVLDFDTSNDMNMFDQNLKNVYHKAYVTHQYIYKDDTIRTIKNKICVSFKNNPKFDTNAYIIPPYQYLWSEYRFGNKIEKVMIGQKWIVRNDVLKLDIEPNNNIRVYEDLRGNLRLLRDNVKRHGKIKKEDDEFNILTDYDGYYTNNEIFMIDIYNELGLNYDATFDEIKNLNDVYIKIYFPRIRPDDIKSITEFLSTNNNTTNSIRTEEINKLQSIYETINNDLILENEIINDIEIVRKSKANYQKIFKQNYIIQTVVRVYITTKGKKLDLFRIFDDFITDKTFPFIQYQTNDGRFIFKFQDNNIIERKDILTKWFENSPYGLSFKVRIDESSNINDTDDNANTNINSNTKYMVINLNENGRLDYKISWKEEDASTIEDIDNTYQYVWSLIKKINRDSENSNIYLELPKTNEFKFAFLNTIQKFELPEKFSINHNDFSEFSRYFFPYVALVIEPRKRQSRTKKEQEEKSKFGTYLRYKRVSKYENKSKIEHRIIFFMKNYDYNDTSLANEIAKQFNITEERALEEIKTVRDKNPNIKKSRKVLKKLENIPKYKPPGIGIDIQGKGRENYKIRIAGARDKEQLDRIISFMNILIYLYSETYLYKKPERQHMKERLKLLSNIARRRNKVDDIVDYEHDVNTLKQMASRDKTRVGWKPEKGQDQYSRSCQNSGKDKRRQPKDYLENEIDKLTQSGYTFNAKTGQYERKIKKNKNEITLRAVKLPLDDGGSIYYTCNPESNGEHMYIGFLIKSNNPYGKAPPCCFKKDPLNSKNKEKKEFYLKSIGQLSNENVDNKIIGDKLYILQDTNKIQEGRFGFLPKYLDIFLNIIQGRETKTKNHYLITSPKGYFFKYGTRQEGFRYLNAIGAIFDLTSSQIQQTINKVLLNDKSKAMIFTSLNNGDIRTQFGTVENYLSFIDNIEVDPILLNDLLCIPGILTRYGCNIILFNKKTKIIKKELEKERIKEDYYISCENPENINNFSDMQRETCFIMVENKSYYPIILVRKPDENSREVTIEKLFKFENVKTNIVNQVLQYYKLNCATETKLLEKNELIGHTIRTAKQTYRILTQLNNKDYLPKYQIIDSRYKCKFICTYNKTIIPVMPSGSLYNLPITTTHTQTQNQIDYLLPYKETKDNLTELYHISHGSIDTLPIGIYYSKKTDNDYTVQAIITQSHDSVPVQTININKNTIKNHKLLAQNKPLNDEIDKEILLGPKNFIVDDRIIEVNKNDYETELYQLFRLHLSYFLNGQATSNGQISVNKKAKDRIEKIINDHTIKKSIRRIEIKRTLYNIINNDLYKIFNDLLSKSKIQTHTYTQKQKAGSDNDNNENEDDNENENENDEDNDNISNNNIEHGNVQIPANRGHNQPRIPHSNSNSKKNPKWIQVLPNDSKIDYTNYVVKNNRNICYQYKQKEDCKRDINCSWSKNGCLLAVQEDLLIDFVNRITEEFIQNELKSYEILRRDNYFVSDIVDYNRYTERPNQKIITSTNNNINKILTEIFGQYSLPQIGKRKNKIDMIQNNELLNTENPLKQDENWYVQEVMENSNSIYRAFANSYYWINNTFSEITYRNLGFYSPLQTDLANYFKSNVIDYLLDNVTSNEIKQLESYIKYRRIGEFIVRLSNDTYTLTNGIVELYILSKIYKISVHIYDENYKVLYSIDPINGVVYDHVINNKSFVFTKSNNPDISINLQYIYITHTYPDQIKAIYPIINA
jgi:hypothetical protein